ncbi:MAG: hypothetical protein LBB41_01665, partial [Prevotellaceae bacterium]|nr:hypothetical protein [Prevotellaceae bacterium]
KQIIRNENPEMLRRYAQLNKFRKAEKPLQNQMTSAISANNPQDADFEFVINNQLVYRSLSDFKSKEALQLFQAFEKERVMLNKSKEDLENLRYQYAVSTNSEKQQVTPKILELENNIPEKEINLDNLQQKIRNLEVQKINSKN